MNTELLKSICVRVNVFLDGGKLFSTGSGFIISNENKFHVVTAEHCIFGSEERLETVSPNSIMVEYKFNNSNDFRTVKVISLDESNTEDDWAILTIENPEIEFDFKRIHLIKAIPPFEKFFFRGYPKKYENKHRKYECKFLDLDTSTFTIKLSEDTFADTLGTDGRENAKGLSGSGLFIVRGNNLYLTGILLKVIGRAALNDDIICGKADFLNGFLPQTDILDNIDILEQWMESSQAYVSDKDINNWIESRVKEVENLMRKNNVLYSPEKAKSLTHECIVEFLVTEKKVDNLRKTYPDLIKKFNESANSFEKNVKRIYSKDVENRKEALEILEKVKAEFSKNLKEIFMDKGDIISNELGLYKITEWLQNCSLDFKG